MLEFEGVVQVVGGDYEPFLGEQLVLGLLVRVEEVKAHFNEVFLEFPLLARLGLSHDALDPRGPPVVFLVEEGWVVGGTLQCVHCKN